MMGVSTGPLTNLKIWRCCDPIWTEHERKGAGQRERREKEETGRKGRREEKKGERRGREERGKQEGTQSVGGCVRGGGTART
jgi:hypothetical protein